MTLGEILGLLRDAYCRTSGIEYMHIQEPDQKLWIQQHAERQHTEMDKAEKFRILDKLKSTAGMEDIEERIVFEAALTPQDIHERYGVLDGAIYGLASHGRYLGAFKPANRSPDVRGLYLAGGSAHPGPGMPMALMSGWIAADVTRWRPTRRYGLWHDRAVFHFLTEPADLVEFD